MHHTFRPFDRRRLFFAAATLVAAFGMHGAEANDERYGAATEAQIRQLQDSLVPPVLVTNEAPERRSLADRMTVLRIPAVSVAVIRNGRIDWARGFGVTKLDGPAVTADTLFQAASISKPVTAFAVMRLVQQGKLDLDTDVNRYLKSWRVPSNKFTEQTKVTLRLLLSHNAGVTVHGFPGYKAGTQLPTLTQMLNGTSSANNSAIFVDLLPGSQFRYSGGGYVIIQQLLEDVTGTPFADLMRTLVLGPVGMSRSTFAQPLPAARLHEVAVPYRQNGAPLKGGPHVYPEMAPAGLWTTPTDLARFAIELQQALAGKSKLLSSALAKEMLTARLPGVGLGIQVGEKDKRPFFAHGGSNKGYRSFMLAYHKGDGFVVMSNSDSGAEIHNDIARTLTHLYDWPDKVPVYTRTTMDAESFDDYVGVYRLDAANMIAITREGEHLYAQFKGRPRWEIHPFAPHAFFAKEVPTEFHFTGNSTDEGTRLSVKQFGSETTATQMDAESSRMLIDTFAALNKKAADQTPTPEGKQILLRLLEGIAAGKPDYASMSQSAALNLRAQAVQLQKALMRVGDVRSVTFRGIEPTGGDVFDVEFENALAEIRLVLLADGKIDALGFELQ